MIALAREHAVIFALLFLCACSRTIPIAPDIYSGTRNSSFTLATVDCSSLQGTDVHGLSNIVTFGETYFFAVNTTLNESIILSFGKENRCYSLGSSISYLWVSGQNRLIAKLSDRGLGEIDISTMHYQGYVAPHLSSAPIVSYGPPDFSATAGHTFITYSNSSNNLIGFDKLTNRWINVELDLNDDCEGNQFKLNNKSIAYVSSEKKYVNVSYCGTEMAVFESLDLTKWNKVQKTILSSYQIYITSVLSSGRDGTIAINGINHQDNSILNLVAVGSNLFRYVGYSLGVVFADQQEAVLASFDGRTIDVSRKSLSSNKTQNSTSNFSQCLNVKLAAVKANDLLMACLVRGSQPYIRTLSYKRSVDGGSTWQ